MQLSEIGISLHWVILKWHSKRCTN
uniref:Uncharacterized protein n=1 Tax=Anguilla anguilla TaxID=7936 RepID=A0A0E9UDM4_ANGAN